MLVFYCARERRSNEVGVSKTLVALDMSWLCLVRSEDADGNLLYQFGEGGYVKKFMEDAYGKDRYACSGVKCRSYLSHFVSTTPPHPNRIGFAIGLHNVWIARAPRCHLMYYDGHQQPDIPQEYLRALYNKRLAWAKSATKRGRHYAQGCHHYCLPDNCWVIDSTSQHFVDIVVVMSIHHAQDCPCTRERCCLNTVHVNFHKCYRGVVHACFGYHPNSGDIPVSTPHMHGGRGPNNPAILHMCTDGQEA